MFVLFCYCCCFFCVLPLKHYLCWVPSHVGIRGIKKEDIAAKSALEYHILILNTKLTSIVFKKASFCQAGPGRLTVLLQAVTRI